MSGSSSDYEWYLARDGQQYGPITDAELKKVIELGHLRSEDLIWRAGFAKWSPAAEIFEEYFANSKVHTKHTDTKDTGTKDTDTKREPETIATPSSPTSGGPSNTIPDKKTATTPTSSPASQQPKPQSATQSKTTAPHSAPAEKPSDHHRPQSTNWQAFYPEGQSERQPEAPSTTDNIARSHPRAPALGDPGAMVSNAKNQQRPDRPHAPGQQTHRPLTHSPEQHQAPEQHQGPSPIPRGATSAPPHSTQNLAPRRDAYAPPDEEDDDYQPPQRRSIVGLITTSLLLASVVGCLSASGWWVYTNPRSASKLYVQLTGQSIVSNPIIVPAPKGVAREPASTSAATRQPASISAARQPAPPSELPQPITSTTADVAPQPAAPIPAAVPAPPPPPTVPLLGTTLWQQLKLDFPEWSRNLLSEIERSHREEKSEKDLSALLVQAMVALRRNNARTALSAPPANLEAVATAFVVNLQFLTKTSVKACYGYISEGEMSASVLPIFIDPGKSGPLPAQSIAILEALKAGKKFKTVYQKPTRTDFDTLSVELTKRGWSSKDLQLFSDPGALSKAPPEQVCRLVTEWFDTQLSLPDNAQKMRLLAASLNPVIAG